MCRVGRKAHADYHCRAVAPVHVDLRRSDHHHLPPGGEHRPGDPLPGADGRLRRGVLAGLAEENQLDSGMTDTTKGPRAPLKREPSGPFSVHALCINKYTKILHNTAV